MKIQSAEFLLSAARQADYPPGDRPEVAFLGRSNVGKSSLINSLLNRRRLAKTSRTPGKTRTINFFEVNGDFFFVDLPGYGYAKISRSLHAGWQKMIETYLSERANLQGAVLLVDLRHPPTKLDRQMKEWLDHFGRPTVVAATKADKVGSSRLQRHLKTVREELPIKEGQLLLPYSASTGFGKDHLWSALRGLLRGDIPVPPG
jgi:GTP-binding protein